MTAPSHACQSLLLLIFPGQDLHLAGHDFVELLLRPVSRSVPACPQTAEYTHRYALLDFFEIPDISSTPCYNVVPHAFVHSVSLACLVKEVSDHGEVGYLAPVVFVCPDCSYNALQFNPVDVFDVFHKKTV